MSVSENSRDLSVIKQPGDRLLVFDDFPAGYLLTNLRPPTSSIWMLPTSAYPSVRRDLMLSYYRKRDVFPTLVLQMKRISRPDDPGLTYPADDPIVRMVDSSYVPVVERGDYVIYRLKPGENSPLNILRR